MDKKKKLVFTAKVKPFVTVAVYRALMAAKEKNEKMQEKEWKNDYSQREKISSGYKMESLGK